MPTRRRLPRRVSLFVFGAVAAWLGMMADHGNGWSPLLFILFGMVAGPTFETWASRGATGVRRAARRGAVLLGIAGVAWVAAAVSIRDDPVATFTETFGSPPPAGVVNLRGSKQWYDGLDHIVAFDADQATLDRLVVTAPMPLERIAWLDAEDAAAPAEELAKLRRAMITPFFDVNRLRLRPLTHLTGWRQSKPLPTATAQMQSSDLVFWDSTSGQAVLVHGWH